MDAIPVTARGRHPATATGPRRIRGSCCGRARAGRPRRGHGDRQPHPGLVLRPRRDLRRRRPRWTPCDRAVADGADIVDIGGVKAGIGADVDADEEIRRVVPFVATRPRPPPGPGDQRRHLAGRGRRAACEAGADLINDTWAGADPALAEVAAQFGAGIVCSHTGGAAPRTNPFRVQLPGRRGCGHRRRPRRPPPAWSPPGCRGRASSSTRRTTSARTPGTASNCCTAPTSSSRPAGRC